MKVLHVCTSDRGGAAIAAIRLHKAMLNEGIDSNILFLKQFDKSIPKAFIHNSKNIFNRKYLLLNRIKLELKIKLDKLKLKKRKYSFELFTWPNSSFDITINKCYQEADIVNLHWVSNFINYNDFFSKTTKKICWTLHDQNPFTGGCHYSNGCLGYTDQCTNCPQLEGLRDTNQAAVILKDKRNSLQYLPTNQLSIICLSNWLLQCSQNSINFKSFKHYLIPNSIDSKAVGLIDKKQARNKLKLPENKIIFLFVAQEIHNPRKGFHLLRNALNKINSKEKVCLCILGYSDKITIDDIEIFNFGFIKDHDVLNKIYAGSDYFIIPSIEDNLPNTVIESLICGTPVIGFNIGGIPDLVQRGVNGIVIEKPDSNELAITLNQIIDEVMIFDNQQISLDALSKYSPFSQTQKYLALYESMLQKKGY